MSDLLFRKKVIHYCILGFVAVSILGTLSHFFYEWSGENKIIGLFTAVNESTWEHMKLIFFPMLLFYLLIFLKFRNSSPMILTAMLMAIIAGTLSIPVLFYTYTGVLGYMITILNLAVFYISVLLSFIIFYIFSNRTKSLDINIILYLIITLFTCMFFLFSYDPPSLGIFNDPIMQ